MRLKCMNKLEISKINADKATLETLGHENW